MVFAVRQLYESPPAAAKISAAASRQRGKLVEARSGQSDERFRDRRYGNDSSTRQDS
jgi:hypothetical protein